MEIFILVKITRSFGNKETKGILRQYEKKTRIF